jgi:hypothetical protein
MNGTKKAMKAHRSAAKTRRPRESDSESEVDSEVSWVPETQAFKGYSRVNVGGGKDPKIHQVQVKDGTKVWCTYNDKTYYQIAGKGKPHEWTQYTWPKKYEKLWEPLTFKKPAGAAFKKPAASTKKQAGAAFKKKPAASTMKPAGAAFKKKPAASTKKPAGVAFKKKG